MKSKKRSDLENKRLAQLEKYEKKESSIILTKSNPNSNYSRFTENFNIKNEYIKTRIFKNTEVN